MADTPSAAPLMLSVSGVRGLVGRSLTPDVVAKYAAAFGQWVVDGQAGSGAGSAPVVVLGRDSRPSGEMFEMAAASGLASAGCTVVRLGVATTPGVAIMVEHLRAAGGMVVTASHNPIIWNGLKPLRHDGVAPPPEQATAIIDRFKRGDITYAEVDALQPTREDRSAARVHVEAILPHIDVDAIRAAKLKVVVDSVHGAGGEETRELLHALGFDDSRIVHLYAEPTGLFPHTPEPLRENLTELAAAVKRHGADIGFAQDPDADRLALVDDRGEYMGEEYTLALCGLHVLRKGDVAAANLSTSRMLDDIAAKAGATVVRSPVGEANVAKAMRGAGAVLGGEGNGGIIWSKVIHVRDSLVGIALLLEMLAKRKRRLSEIAREIPAYAIVKDKVPFDAALAASLVDRLRARFPKQRIDLQDGVRIDWDPPESKWVHVRPSNTEPIVRLIAEAGDEAVAKALLREVRDALGIS